MKNQKWLNIIQMIVRLFSGLFISGVAFQSSMIWFADVFAKGDVEWARYLFALLQMAGQITLTWVFAKFKVTDPKGALDEDMIATAPPIVALIFPVSHEFLGFLVSMTGIVDLGQGYGWWERIAGQFSRMWAARGQKPGPQIIETRQTVRPGVERPGYAETTQPNMDEPVTLHLAERNKEEAEAAMKELNLPLLEWQSDPDKEGWLIYRTKYRVAVAYVGPLREKLGKMLVKV